MCRDPRSVDPVLPAAVLRPASYDELNDLCRGIKKSFVHLETRDSYGTEVELPHMAKWRRAEPDDFAWLGWWLEMLGGHRAAGRTCRRARVVSEPLSDYQRWTRRHATMFIDAGEDIRYLPRPHLAPVAVPGSGDFYVFDDELVLFLHDTGNGTNASFQITERNIRDWCAASGAEDQITDLIATAKSVETAYLEWVRQSRAGMKRLGDLHSIATYQRTATFRIHEPIVLPGIFQAEAYIRRMLTFWYAFLDAPGDADATVAMKAKRTAIALRPAKRIAVVLGEQALRTRRGTPSEHTDQLTHLLSLMRLPFISVGVIPAGVQWHAIATIGFWIFDNNAVALETPTAAIKVTRPQEIAHYVVMFNQLQDQASYGHDARQLVAKVLVSL